MGAAMVVAGVVLCVVGIATDGLAGLAGAAVALLIIGAVFAVVAWALLADIGVTVAVENETLVVRHLRTTRVPLRGVRSAEVASTEASAPSSRSRGGWRRVETVIDLTHEQGRDAVTVSMGLVRLQPGEQTALQYALDRFVKQQAV